MSTFVRTTEHDNHRSARRRRRLLTALVATIATVTGPLVVAGVPAAGRPDRRGLVGQPAGDRRRRPGRRVHVGRVVLLQPPDTPASAWPAPGTSPRRPPRRPAGRPHQRVRGPGRACTPGSACTRPPADRQRRPRRPCPRRWAATSSTPAPQICCTTPSNGFLYGDVATFDNLPGRVDTYGFRLSGPEQRHQQLPHAARSRSAPAPTSTPTPRRPGQPAVVRCEGPHRPRGLAGQASCEAGEARWYKFQVFPGQEATVTSAQPLPRLRPRAVRRHRRGVRPAEPGRATSTQLGGIGIRGAVGAAPRCLRCRRTSTDDRRPRPRHRCPRPSSPRGSTRRGSMHRGSTRRGSTRRGSMRPRVYAPRVYAPGSYLPDLTANAGLPRRVLRRPGPDAPRRVRPTPTSPTRRVTRLHRQHPWLVLRARPGPRRQGLRRPPALLTSASPFSGSEECEGVTDTRPRPPCRRSRAISRR